MKQFMPPNIHKLSTITLLSLGLVVGRLSPATALTFKAQPHTNFSKSTVLDPSLDIKSQLKTINGSTYKAGPASAAYGKQGKAFSGGKASHDNRTVQFGVEDAPGFSAGQILAFIAAFYTLLAIIFSDDGGGNSTVANATSSDPTGGGQSTPADHHTNHNSEHSEDPEDPEDIPTPALLPGLIGLGLSALRKQRQENQASA
jgi:hypothetical protein